MSLKAGVNAFLLVVVIGIGLKAWLEKYPHTEAEVDFVALKGSLLISAIGSLCLGLATELWFGIMGQSSTSIQIKVSIIQSNNLDP